MKYTLTFIMAIALASCATKHKKETAHANWVVEIGNIVIAGCQVFYSILCPDLPSFGPHKGWSIHEGKILDVEKPNMIYNANSLSYTEN